MLYCVCAKMETHSGFIVVGSNNVSIVVYQVAIQFLQQIKILHVLQQNQSMLFMCVF